MGNKSSTLEARRVNEKKSNTNTSSLLVTANAVSPSNNDKRVIMEDRLLRLSGIIETCKSELNDLNLKIKFLETAKKKVESENTIYKALILILAVIAFAYYCYSLQFSTISSSITVDRETFPMDSNNKKDINFESHRNHSNSNTSFSSSSSFIIVSREILSSAIDELYGEKIYPNSDLLWDILVVDAGQTKLSWSAVATLIAAEIFPKTLTFAVLAVSLGVIFSVIGGAFLAAYLFNFWPQIIIESLFSFSLIYTFAGRYLYNQKNETFQTLGGILFLCGWIYIIVTLLIGNFRLKANSLATFLLLESMVSLAMHQIVPVGPFAVVHIANGFLLLITIFGNIDFNRGSNQEVASSGAIACLIYGLTCWYAASSCSSGSSSKYGNRTFSTFIARYINYKTVTDLSVWIEWTSLIGALIALCILFGKMLFSAKRNGHRQWRYIPFFYMVALACTGIALYMENFPMFAVAHLGLIALLPLELGTSFQIKEIKSSKDRNDTWRCHLDGVTWLKMLIPCFLIIFAEVIRSKTQETFGYLSEVYSSVLLGQISLCVHILASYVTSSPRVISIASLTCNILVVLASIFISRPFLLFAGLLNIAVLVFKLGIACNGSIHFFAALILLSVMIMYYGIQIS